MINVTKSYLPPIDDYIFYLRKIWKSGNITNNGDLIQELENKLKKYLGIKHIQIVSNGTLSLQIAIKALGLSGEIITTPFSYVATTSAILWENCDPVFVDINDKTFCIDVDKIENAITDKTSAILATHVYGIPCDVHKIKMIANKYNLKIIYDGAHAFGVKINNQSIFNYGDISILSFHATKLFHTVEGGAIITKSNELNKKIFLYKSFGHIGDKYYNVGINGKNSELHAAMGLSCFPHISNIIEKRKELSEYYDKKLLKSNLKFPEKQKNISYNYSYYPVIFNSENELLKVINILKKNDIFPRRYFYPSLNKLHYIKKYYSCKVSEKISSRILCLPLYYELKKEEIDLICNLILKSLL